MLGGSPAATKKPVPACINARCLTSTLNPMRDEKLKDSRVGILRAAILAAGGFQQRCRGRIPPSLHTSCQNQMG